MMGDGGLELKNFGLRIGVKFLMTSLLNPIEYAKILIQIGFEPIPPRPTKNFFGKPALALPDVFTYVKYIHSVDGTTGLFRGLSPRLCNAFVTAVCHGHGRDERKLLEDNSSEDDAAMRLGVFTKKLSSDIIMSTTCIVISHPFQVVAIRMMAQFIGRETKYDGVFGSLCTIFEEEGLSGWFSGLIPRLVGELSSLLLISTFRFVVNNCFITGDRRLPQLMAFGVDFFIKNLTYPFYVVSVCMAVNNSGLKAGSPPRMPRYNNDWLNCWHDLSKSNQLKRGSGLIWRYYSRSPQNEIRPSVLTTL